MVGHRLDDQILGGGDDRVVDWTVASVSATPTAIPTPNTALDFARTLTFAVAWMFTVLATITVGVPPLIRRVSWPGEGARDQPGRLLDHLEELAGLAAASG